MAHYLVVGGAGFIGSHIVDELIQRGEQVRVLDDFSTGKLENLRDGRSRIELIEGDIRVLEMARHAMRGVDYVLHQGALSSVPRSVADPLTTNEVNVTGTLNLLRAAVDAGVKRFVFASSSSVYGNTPTLPKCEDMATDPLSPYAVSKLAGERYCRAFHEVYGLPTVALRYFNVFGPRQDPGSEYSAVIPKFIESVIRGKPPTIYGDGTQSRDFTYVSNVVKANLLACECDEAIGQMMNVACGEQHTLIDFCHRLSVLTGKTFRPNFSSPRVGDVKHSLAALDRAKQLLGYRPEVSWEEGLRRTVAWHRGRMAGYRSTD